VNEMVGVESDAGTTDIIYIVTRHANFKPSSYVWNFAMNFVGASLSSQTKSRACMPGLLEFINSELASCAYL